ncbi:MAG: GIY-YIG nuclease family protein [Chloroflexi bacterium]|nr:GIY-YIG nuclease family protein [Chloroflexota bacterium]
MGNPGFIYVLVNSSMPGLVKVGKTIRDPDSRAGQLSGATGVATPFIVAYHEFFDDCDAAEQFIHSFLESRGYRVAPNREFFNAPTSLVVKAIVSAPGKPGSSHPDSRGYHRAEPVRRERKASNSLAPDDDVENNEDEANDEVEEDEEDFGNEDEREEEEVFPWSELMDQAYAHFFGEDDTLEDHRQALRLFKQAAKLGSPEACEWLGTMFMLGDGARVDTDRALDYYQQGGRRRNYRCYAHLGQWYLVEGHFANAQKCWSRFFDSLRSDQEADAPRYAHPMHVCEHLWIYILRSLEARSEIEHRDVLESYADAVVATGKDEISRKKGSGESYDDEVKALKWVYRNVSSGSALVRWLRSIMVK